jgi:hypothetical protein
VHLVPKILTRLMTGAETEPFRDQSLSWRRAKEENLGILLG